MEKKIVLADTSIFIDFFRKSNKDNSKLLELIRQDYEIQISAITDYEIYCGALPNQIEYWNKILEFIKVLPFDRNVSKIAVEINATLKKKSKQIDIADLFISATAIANNLPLATLNLKHFERIEPLRII